MSVALSVIDRSREEYLPGGDLLIAAVKDNEVVGTQHVELTSDRQGRTYWLLNTLYVKPSHRRQGIATALIAKAVEVCRQVEVDEQLGRLEIDTVIHVENDPSVHAVHANGFTLVDDGEMVMLTYRRKAQP